MLGWLMVLCSAMIMYKAAEMERRSGLVWGAYTVICCVGIAHLVPTLFLINIFLGLAAAFATMFAANILRDRKHS